MSVIKSMLYDRWISTSSTSSTMAARNNMLAVARTDGTPKTVEVFNIDTGAPISGSPFSLALVSGSGTPHALAWVSDTEVMIAFGSGTTRPFILNTTNGVLSDTVTGLGAFYTTSAKPNAIASNHSQNTAVYIPSGGASYVYWNGTAASSNSASWRGSATLTGVCAVQGTSTYAYCTSDSKIYVSTLSGTQVGSTITLPSSVDDGGAARLFYPCGLQYRNDAIWVATHEGFLLQLSTSGTLVSKTPLTSSTTPGATTVPIFLGEPASNYMMPIYTIDNGIHNVVKIIDARNGAEIDDTSVETGSSVIASALIADNKLCVSWNTSRITVFELAETVPIAIPTAILSGASYQTGRVIRLDMGVEGRNRVVSDTSISAAETDITEYIQDSLHMEIVVKGTEFSAETGDVREVVS